MRERLVLNNDGTVSNVLEDDLQADIDIATRARNAAAMKGQRYKQSFTHVAHVPPIVIEKIKNEHGVNFFDKNDMPKFCYYLRTEYPHLMTMPGKPFTGFKQ